MMQPFGHSDGTRLGADIQRSEAFFAVLPKGRMPVLCALPHSSREYPEAFLQASVLNETQIRSSEDAYVDVLLNDFPKMGLGLFAARTPRAYLDLNRSETELDAQVIHGVGRGRMTPRLNSGLGVVPRVVAGGRHIYRGKIALAEAQARIDRFHRPYHGRLAGLLAADRARHGQSILLDWHSMPHEAVSALGKDAPEIVIGDLFGKSAERGVVEAIITAFQEEGFRVAQNTPFAGAYVLQRHGLPHLGQHAVQIEIDRALYMNERGIVPHTGFEWMKTRLRAVMERFLARVTEPPVLAAE